VARDFVAQVPSNALGAVAPKNNFLLTVDHAHPGRQAFEDAAADLGIVK
jgi:hypothetical protein